MRWVYVWANGVHSGLRAVQAKLCTLVVIGANERGQKCFLAIEDCVRESTISINASWAIFYLLVLCFFYLQKLLVS